MGVKYLHPDVLDGGPLVIKNNAVKMVLIKTYAFGDSYATVMGNALATATVSPTDFTITTSGNSRVLTVAAGKTATATADAIAGQGDHEIAFTDGVSRILWVADETGELPDHAGDTIGFPSVSLTENQPT